MPLPLFRPCSYSPPLHPVPLFQTSLQTPLSHTHTHTQSDDPLRAIVGVASVPLAGLAQGVPVEGAFKLTNPVTRQPAGRVVLGLGWHNPLQLPGAVPKRESCVHRMRMCGNALREACVRTSTGIH